MCDVLLPPGVNPTAVKYIRKLYHIISYIISYQLMIWRWPSQNTLGLWTVLYWTRSSRTQFSVSINVWILAGNTLNITCNFLYCNHQAHRNFWITLYILPVLSRVSLDTSQITFFRNYCSRMFKELVTFCSKLSRFKTPADLIVYSLGTATEPDRTLNWFNTVHHFYTNGTVTWLPSFLKQKFGDH
jgi:hypothetical protein